MDKIISVLNANADNAPDEMVADFQNLPVNPQTGEYDLDAQNAFLKKWSPYIQENFQNWEEIDYKQGQPLSERLSADNVSYDKPNENIIEGLARKYNSTPEEISKALSEIKAKTAASNAEEQKAKDYQKERQLLADRQKAVDNYQHSYFGMDKDNLLNIGLNKLADLVISDDTKRAIVEDPNNTSRIIGNAAVDIGGTALDFTPGAGKAAKAVSYLAGPALRTGRDVAEGKSGADIAKNAAIDFGGNVVLGEGLKGISGLGDMGALRKVEEKIPTNEWAETARTSNKSLEKSWPKIEGVSTNKKQFDAALKGQPSSAKKEYKSIYNSNEVQGNQELLEKKIEEARKKHNAQVQETNRERISARSELKGKIVKPFVGQTIDAGTIGIERSATKKLKTTPPKYTKPSEVKDIKTHDDALNYIIENTKSQWEAGFKPNPVKGDILFEAYKKWESER